MSIFGLLFRMRRHPRLAYTAIFLGFFAFLLTVLAGLGVLAVRLDIDHRVNEEAAGFDTFWQNAATTIEALHSPPGVAPCSDPFLNWMRRVAFLPDGIHEIVYVTDGLIRCSVSLSHVDPPVPIDAPDYLSVTGIDTPVWLDRDLGMLGFPGVVGTLVGLGNFILVMPKLELKASLPEWINYETVALDAAGIVRHRSGNHGLFSFVTGVSDAQPLGLSYSAGFSASSCGVTRTLCLAILAPYGAVLEKSGPVVGVGAVLAALVAAAAALLLRGVLERAWSLPSRLQHRLSIDTVVCHYQPLLDVQKDQFCGIEVLARWRDDDGRLIYPDEFLPIIEKRDLHRAFTRHVVDRAYRELSRLAVGPRPMRVHFNIFPSEFDVDAMLALFEDFLADRSRFTVVIELVESDALPIEPHARRHRPAAGSRHSHLHRRFRRGLFQHRLSRQPRHLRRQARPLVRTGAGRLADGRHAGERHRNGRQDRTGPDRRGRRDGRTPAGAQDQSQRRGSAGLLHFPPARFRCARDAVLAPGIRLERRGGLTELVACQSRTCLRLRAVRLGRIAPPCVRCASP